MGVHDTNIAATGATDDAAAAGQIYTAGGLFQSYTTVDELDTGDVGRSRLSIRRATVIASDYSSAQLTAGSVALIRDMMTSATYQGTYAAPTAPASATWTAGQSDTRWFRVGMGAYGFRRASIGFTNGLDKAVTLSVRLWVTGGTNAADQFNQFSRSIAAGSSLNLQGQPPGDGSSSLAVCPGLHDVPCAFLVVGLAPAAAVTGDGSITLWFGRSS